MDAHAPNAPTDSLMRQVDMATVLVVHSGDPWLHPKPPCNRQMIHMLEKNESLVTWVQGTVDDQYPVMHVDGKHYTMSLRMMKAVWRSVRLRKGFVNLERAPFGGNKLRIPSLLFFEKMRTQSRFNLMRGDSHNASTDAPAVCCPKARKQMHNASSKVAVVVEKMLLPLLDTPLRSHVVFDPVCDQAELNLLEEVDHKNPGLMADCGAFTSHILTLYDRYHAYHRHSAHTMTSTTDCTRP